MIQKVKRKFNTAEKVVLCTGILLIILSFISELNFHYLQAFRPELVDPSIFWRAEAAELFNSMSFLVLGISLIIIAYRLSKKRITSERNE
ncbi:MAG: hypothetical protein ACFE9C_09300 [Candidatus Hodarchaeota archaeon]